MPCEGCNAQFGVFKRKRTCMKCWRNFCNHCLTKRHQIILCEKCLIFSKRPLNRAELLSMKPKDLIYYLQSHHISTTGCVEKEELVNLIMENADNPSCSSLNDADDVENARSSFNNFKQQCQQIFNNFTDKISSDIRFDGQTSSPPSSSSSSSPNLQQNINNGGLNVITREIPAYSENCNQNSNNSNYCHTNRSNRGEQDHPINFVPNAFNNNSNINENAPHTIVLSSDSSPSSPINSISSLSSQSMSSQARGELITTVHGYDNNVVVFENMGDDVGCDCSDDEVITKYKARQKQINIQMSQKKDKSSLASQSDSAFEDQIAGPSGSTGESVSDSKSLNNNQKRSDRSLNSSFEELGAAGGGGSGSSFGCGAVSDNDIWQIDNKTEIPDENFDAKDESIKTKERSFPPVENDPYLLHSNNLTDDKPTEIPQKVPRYFMRRRSDTYVYKQSLSEPGPSGFHQQRQKQQNNEESDYDQMQSSCKRLKTSCKRCGKSKQSIERQVEKFKKQLESSYLSAADIRHELALFMEYLQQRANSLDHSDSDTHNDSNEKMDEGESSGISNQQDNNTFEMDVIGINDGIHVYGHDEPPQQSRHNSRFINLSDYKSSSELDDLSVKQLKEILMLNRVDYKGCCEKQELLDRVKRLWNELQSCPKVDTLTSTDLCKICMDAPIECVLLECGHMATCTNCGKVLNECPICRQYIVRIVRFFKA